MSVDFATFDLTELAVLDAADVAAPADTAALRASHTARFLDDMDDLLGKPGMEVVGPMCCSCVTSASCCCCSQ
ncbi:hypothetical protein ACFZB9_07425 [Kitasatospora sp. NPDC008050]|uniref:hypothetical protein n=1 Tax=Kitasatospora sp. NPDC008050 TaxID=3364021 RepID=UPI0036E10531